jgi:hypothetical protein
MADVKISALPSTTTTAAGDVYPLVQGGVTKHIDFDDIVDSIPDASATVRGVVTTGTQTLAGNKTLQGDSPTVGNALVVQNSTPTSKLTVANAGRVTVGQDTTVTTEVCAVIMTDVTNANLVIAPNGTGAIIADIPDGTAAGGNARGNNAVDLQTSRTNAVHVASGLESVISGGIGNRATNQWAVVGGGNANSANGDRSCVLGGSGNNSSVAFSSILGGQDNAASGNNATIGGGQINTASGEFSTVSGGARAIASRYGQRANASGRFAADSDAQTSSLTFRRSITGTAITELFLDGSSLRAILALPTGATNARAWSGKLDLVAIVATAGGGGLSANETFMGNYTFAILRKGTTTQMTPLISPSSVLSEFADAGMADCLVTIDADDTTEALRIQFTPPSTADGTTVIRVVATAYLTEVGR